MTAWMDRQAVEIGPGCKRLRILTRRTRAAMSAYGWPAHPFAATLAVAVLVSAWTRLARPLDRPGIDGLDPVATTC